MVIKEFSYIRELNILQTRPTYSLLLNGTNEYVQAPVNGPYVFEWTDAFTVSSWFTSDFLPGFFPAGAWSKYHDQTGWFLFITRGRIVLDMRTGVFINGRCINVTADFATLGVPTPTAGTHHIVFTYDGSGTAAGVNFYLDNVPMPITLIDRNPISTGTIIQGGFDELEIGAITNPLGAYMDGEVEDFRMWDVELTPAQVAQEWNFGVTKQVPILPGNLVAHCNMGDFAVATGSSLTMPDGAGGGFNFTGINMNSSNIICTP